MSLFNLIFYAWLLLLCLSMLNVFITISFGLFSVKDCQALSETASAVYSKVDYNEL